MAEWESNCQIYQIISETGENRDWLIDWFIYLLCLTPLSAVFQLYHGDQFSGGRSRSTRKEPPSMGKQLVNCITCGCESGTPFL
jgi:hypothetical protein